MTKITKRDLLKGTLFGAGGLGLKALATGLPPAFLLNRRTAFAQSGPEPTYLILSNASAGHPINANAPGTYPVNPDNGNDPLSQIQHPQVANLGTGALGTIDGVEYGAADFETPSDLVLGDTTVLAARPWSALPADLRSRTAFFHHATYANAHPEFANVMKFHGAIKGPTGTGQEMLSSFIAQETAPALGTLMNQPINVGGSQVTFAGRPLGTLDPSELQALFGETTDATTHPTGLADPSQITRLRDAVIDEIYREVRASGAGAQKVFLDRYALGRQQAAALGDSLAPLLTSIAGDAPIDEVEATVALLRLNVTPVVVLQVPFGGDNHQDRTLADEVTETIEAINTLRALWARLVQEGLQDRVTFAFLDVFGRTLLRNNPGGRNHNRDHHAMLMFGPRIRAGVVGGLEPIFRGNGNIRDFGAAAIGSIGREQTLESAGKTLARAVGVPEDRIDLRISGGSVVPSALNV